MIAEEPVWIAGTWRDGAQSWSEREVRFPVD